MLMRLARVHVETKSAARGDESPSDDVNSVEIDDDGASDDLRRRSGHMHRAPDRMGIGCDLRIFRSLSVSPATPRGRSRHHRPIRAHFRGRAVFEHKRAWLIGLMCTIVLSPTLHADAQQAAARNASLTGRVVNKIDATPVVGASVTLPALDRNATTDSAGRFRFDELPAGTQSIRIRHVGLAEVTDTVTLINGGETSQTYFLTSAAVRLDTVRAQAAPVKYLSPALRGFEERRLAKSGGYFISDSTFRRNENSTLANLMQTRMSGFSLRYFGQHRLPVSTHKQCAGPIFLDKNCHGGNPDCLVAIYLDGQLFFNTKIAKALPLPAWPDLEETFPLTELAGAEFYPSAGTAPVDMHVDDDGCGSLWLWTREK